MATNLDAAYTSSGTKKLEPSLQRSSGTVRSDRVSAEQAVRIEAGGDSPCREVTVAPIGVDFSRRGCRLHPFEASSFR